MPSVKTNLRRRHLLQQVSSLTAAAAAPAWAQPGKSADASRAIVIAQVVDFSQAQQDVSKDFLIGSRAAWQDVNARGGIRGRQVQHLAVETDGTAPSLVRALDTVRDNPLCVALSGSVGDQIASQIVAISRQGNLNIAHAAPWLQNSSLDIDDRTFPIFAARQEQIAYALKTLSVMGLKELGTIYGTPQDYTAYHAEVERIATGMQLTMQSFRGAGDLRLMGQKLTSSTPAVLLFIGGTPELADFTQGLEKQARQRYLVALADVNLQTMMQMGTSRNAPVIATQPVPLVNSSLPVVRSYRETLARLFDEPPTPLSLAGYIAARYTYEVLNDLDGPLTRQSALTAFQRRASLDLGGFRISFNAQRRSSNFVTQSMMSANGRLIG
ncbi:MAG: twin-arginine translocation pathway signal protein [Polaromonas sp. 39-63-203]|jgi:ABC-type branched-subunit amino acid transport system substrate-binding protein|uniref:ABC transporter substrate-binding protein n=1 Tax=Polaromonas sp. TaxID=1869339 RepID=UPI000BCE128D|nr:ABC transporter substrate-binding protein [Polaromonas sp.]OYY53136.1 MAG: twin-arginine translocation pathway signal protein [Polaromonas sp. 35-63-240]OYZ84277.1 MAG: twin-arginine translocation pathway signal protein [Polaromonas sp. 24-62-144]OZA99547.1 MAG: twin-arginine translocation pathway signal protein [Polaromonas sp. 39-63-203]HQS31209.1 ABC transporter substrate-binding protein [Polaromonas sp.]HQS89798.1 ABC transporter substrate-binding protein [Polaromonas sp.]